MKIELYVQGKTKNPAIQKKAQARWSIRCVLKDGTLESRDGYVQLPDASTKRAVLFALNQALQKFNKAAVFKIYISDDFVRAVLINGWLTRWKNNNWHKIRLNGEIRHLDLWQQIADKLSNHAVSYAKDEDLRNEILKDMERRLNG